MDKSSEHTTAGRHIYQQVPTHGLDFSRQDPPSPEPVQEQRARKVIHPYTLHARSNDRLKDSGAPAVAGPQETADPAAG